MLKRWIGSLVILATLGLLPGCCCWCDQYGPRAGWYGQQGYPPGTCCPGAAPVQPNCAPCGQPPARYEPGWNQPGADYIPPTGCN